MIKIFALTNIVFYDFFQIIFNMSKGFIDQGKSFDKGLELLDKDYYIKSYLSEKTFDMFYKAKR
jgi:hypothetical protein